MQAKPYLFSAAAALMALFVGANILIQDWMSASRYDFTENRLFTLSEGSKSTLENLSDPIELTFVYTASVGQDYPAVRAYAVRVRELLEGYAAIGGPNIRLREIDPAPFSEAEDEALAAGLVAVETDGADPLYFGLIGHNSVDDERIIPFLAPERETALEYDLTRLIARLDRPEPPRIGLLSTLPGMTTLGEGTGYAILQDIRKAFEVEQIGEGFTTLPPEIDVLMLAHPPVLSDWQLWQIDQFILRKGRALILLDPAAKTAQGSGPFNMTNRQIRSDLNRFAPVWGISLSAEALADTQTALPIEANDESGRATVLRHPLFMSVPPGLMSASNLITADLGRAINLAAPGGFTIDPDVPTQIEALMSSGPAPSTIAAERAALDLSASETLEIYEAGEAPAILAARLTGPLITAFPDGTPQPDLGADAISNELARAAAEEAGPHIATSLADAEIILVSDADMLDDGLFIDLQSGLAFADNSAFILNALDSLAGGSDLMKLRARGPGQRRMVRVDRMREAAQEKFFNEQARLEARLNTSQARLEELQSIGAAGEFFDGELGAELTEAERVELARLRDDIVSTRASLREIERDFRQEIDGLENSLRAFTILLGPVLVGVFGLFVWSRRKLGATR
ncbi:MAG: Gldg family protein [Pseudomonadota bacterium]